MASFDVPVPQQNDREYTNEFRGIQQPQGSQGGAAVGEGISRALSGTGKIIGEGLNLGEQAKQEYIGSRMADQYGDLQEQEVGTLTTKLAQLKNGVNPSLLAPSGGPPPGLENLPGQVQTLDAMKKSGKYDPLYYNMVKDNIAKSARADFPTEHDFIDNEFMHITWRDPANKVIQNLTSDINEYENAAKDGKNKIDSIFLGAAKDGIFPYQMYQAWKADPAKYENRLMQTVADYNAHDAYLKRQDLEIRNAEAKNKLSQEDVGKRIGIGLDQSASNYLDSHTLHIDQMHDDVSASDLHNRVASGDIARPDANTAVAIAQQYSNMSLDWAAQERKRLYEVPPATASNPNPKPMAYYMGGADAVDKLIADRQKRFEEQGKFYAQGDTSVAAAQKESMKNALDAQAQSVLAGNKNLNLMALGPQIFGKDTRAYNDWFSQLSTDPNTVKGLSVPAITSSLGTMMQGPDVKGNGLTMTDVFKRFQNNGVTDPARYSEQLKAAGQTILNHKVIPTAKANLVQGVYEPDLLKLVNDSSINPDGSINPGKSTVVRDLVNDKIGEQIRHTGNADAINKYVSSGDQWIQTIIHSEVQTLNKYAKDPNLQFRFDPESGFKVDYVGKTPGWRPDQMIGTVAGEAAGYYKDLLSGKPHTDQFEDYKNYPTIKASVDRINMALESGKSLSRQFTGEKLDNMTARMLLNAGLDPNQIDDTNAGGLIQAIKATLKTSK